MKRRILTFAGLIAVVFGWQASRPLRSSAGPDALDLVALSQAMADMAGGVLRSTAHLFVDRNGQSDRNSGSGFVIDAIRGLVVTNAHVVGDAASHTRVVLHDGRECTGDVIAADPKTDLAVVRIPEGFARHQVAWGNSDALRPGHMVMAVGNPQQLEFTTSMGVISALNRSIGLPTQGGYEDFLQFDAFIAPGSSGGPLVDMGGRVVGVNTAIAGSRWQGVGYAVPSSIARRVISDLVEFQEVRRGYLGISSKNLSASDAERYGLSRPQGVFIDQVRDDGPAAEAGIKKGDVLLQVNDLEILSQDQLRARISAIPPGEVVRLRIWRNGTSMNFQVRLALLDEGAPPENR